MLQREVVVDRRRAYNARVRVRQILLSREARRSGASAQVGAKATRVAVSLFSCREIETIIVGHRCDERVNSLQRVHDDACRSPISREHRLRISWTRTRGRLAIHQHSPPWDRGARTRAPYKRRGPCVIYAGWPSISAAAARHHARPRASLTLFFSLRQYLRSHLLFQTTPRGDGQRTQSALWVRLAQLGERSTIARTPVHTVAKPRAAAQAVSWY